MSPLDEVFGEVGEGGRLFSSRPSLGASARWAQPVWEGFRPAAQLRALGLEALWLLDPGGVCEGRGLGSATWQLREAGSGLPGTAAQLSCQQVTGT